MPHPLPCQIVCRHVEDEHNQSSRRGVGRPSKSQPFRPFVVDLLLKDPHLKSLEIVRRAKQAGYEGGKSALYSLIASVRPRRSRPLTMQERIPGEISRHGIGQIDVLVGDRDGQGPHTESVTFIVSRLEYARWTAVSLIQDQSVEIVVRTLVRHFELMGGVPLLAAFDRPRPLALRSDKDGQVLEWDPAFAYAAIQLGLGIEVRARRGADRGPGTNLGNWIKHAFFRGRSFVDRADVELQLQDWTADLNNGAQPELGGRTPSLLLAEERQRLRPLKVPPDDLALRFPVVVGPRATVIHDGQGYAMPSDAVGLVGALYLYPSRVVVVAGRWEATHPRFTDDSGMVFGTGATLPLIPQQVVSDRGDFMRARSGLPATPPGVVAAPSKPFSRGI
jgi:hypothetical protein